MTVRRPDAPFGRVITAMVTPFDAHGDVDLDGAVELARHLLAHGSDALVLTGSTGESTVLADDERIAIWEAVIGAVDAPIIAGSTSSDTRHSVELTARATQAGAAGILAVTPYYSRPPQSGIEAHFRAVAAASDLPVICYDVPARTGREIAPETLLRLAQDVPTIIGWKDASGHPVQSARLLTHAPAGFVCYSGDDALTLPLLSAGAVGLISVASHWVGQELSEMIGRFLEGDHDGATAIQSVLHPSFEFESSEDAPNPIPTKAMLRVLGLPAGECRLPVGRGPGGIEERAKRVLADLDTWRHTRS